MRVYIASPYTAPTLEERQANVDRVMDTAIALILMGHRPYVPHLSHYLHERALSQGIVISHAEWLEQDLDWLKLCHVMLKLGDSPGVKIEEEYAKENAIPVFTSIGDLTITRQTYTQGN